MIWYDNFIILGAFILGILFERLLKYALTRPDPNMLDQEPGHLIAPEHRRGRDLFFKPYGKKTKLKPKVNDDRTAWEKENER